nr:Tn3 family transposase [Actinopolyspora mortivallis]
MEMLLEVLAWTGAGQGFTSIAGGEARLADLDITVAARPAPLRCNLAEHGQRPGRRTHRQGRGQHGRATRYVLDVLYDRDGGHRSQMIVTDTASYSDIVFGLLALAGFTCAPQLADLPDQKLWRIDPGADYGPFNGAARGRIDLGRVRRHWDDILRVVASIHTGVVRPHDVIRMLSLDGHPTPLGEAIADYGRIHKTLHVLRLVDEPGYRRDIKAQANLQEGRHAPVRRIFHGQRGELRQRYYEGMEDQVGALGLVLNAVVLFNTRYLDAALAELCGGYEAREEDATRLSPFVRSHINMLGRCSFAAPNLAGTRPLRDPFEPDEEESA